MSKSKKPGARRSGNPANRNRNREIQQLHDLVQPTGNSNPLNYGNVGMAGPGGPRDNGGVVLDTTDLILLESMNVATVDQFSNQEKGLGPAIYMTLSGRVNKKQDHATVGFILGTDGAAALITELLAICTRFSMQAVLDLVERLIELSNEGNIELGVLKMAIDLAQEHATAGQEQP